jgi:3-hydroxyisobutyrate dehydrogenase-like beta-hydroxyacid dehydrogenase
MAKIAFLGLGVIGRPMAERLLDSGHDLVVWNRTEAKARPLVEAGARPASTPREAAQSAEIVVTVLTDGPAVLEILQRPDGLLAGMKPGTVLCDLSTIDVVDARQIAEMCKAHSIGFVRAPILGNRHAARAGKLLVFAGGPADALAGAEPVFAALGEKIWRWDRVEPATAIKLALNLLLAGMMEIFSESLVFAAGAGIDPRTLLDVIAVSALAAPMYQSKGRAILDGMPSPNFTLQNMRKDLRFVLASARQLGTPLPVGSAIESAFGEAEFAWGGFDYSAIAQWLEAQTKVSVSGAGSSSEAPRFGEISA